MRIKRGIAQMVQSNRKKGSQLHVKYLFRHNIHQVFQWLGAWPMLVPVAII
jgi:hypothetical protein